MAWVTSTSCRSLCLVLQQNTLRTASYEGTRSLWGFFLVGKIAGVNALHGLALTQNMGGSKAFCNGESVTQVPGRRHPSRPAPAKTVDGGDGEDDDGHVHL